MNFETDGPDGASIRFERITPARADDDLRNHHPFNFRQINARRRDKLAEIMVAGDWMPTGSTLVYDEDGNLIDGQHRLDAVRKSGVTIVSQVLRGVKRKAVEPFIDTAQYSRNFGHLVRSRGYSNASAIAAGLRILTAWKAGCREPKSVFDVPPSIWNESIAASALDEYGDMAAVAAQETEFAYPYILRPQATFLVLWVGMQRGDESKVTEFLRAVADGVGLGLHHPALTLRARMVRETRIGNKRNEKVAFGMTLSAWNAFADGRTMKRIGWLCGASRSEAGPHYPEIVIPKKLGRSGTRS